MLMRNLRDKKTMHVILWGLVVAFIGGYVLLGKVSMTAGRSDPNIVARVGDETISRSDFSTAYQSSLDKIYAANPEGPSSDETDKLQKDVLDSLIDEKILEETAQKLGVSISDEDLAGVLRRQFSDKSGNFSKDSYYKFLQDRRTTPDLFEASQRSQLLLQKIVSILMDGFLYTNEEVDQYASLMNRELKADYVVLDESTYEKQFKPTESDLKDYYESSRDQYDHPERIKIRHLFQAPPQTEGFQDPEKTKKTLEDYRQQVLSGKAKFGDLAMKYSQDDSSKAKGGEIGWIERGMLTQSGVSKDVETELFNLKKGDITKPFQLQNGYDIVQVEDAEEAYQSTFPEVREKVLKQYLREKAAEKVENLSEQLAEKLKVKETLEKIADGLGLSVSSTGWFQRQTGIPHLGDSKETADELATLYPLQWKGPLSVGQKEYFFQITDAKEPDSSVALTDQQRADISKQMVEERRQAWVKQFLEAQRQKLGVKTYL